MLTGNRIVRLLKCTLLLVGAVIMTSHRSGAQDCVECATGCAGTTVSYVYGNLFCSCPTGSNCVDSGGLCTRCVAGGTAYCYDTLNGCGGQYNNKSSNPCGCKTSCMA
jgi:hypothetical protein